jgi:hypothetical protein
MKLSKDQARKHNQTCELLKKDVLTFDDKIFVIENWNEGAEHINSTAGAFFTPKGLARDFQLAVRRNGRVIDLCAGIGTLSLWLVQQAIYEIHDPLKELICVELNPGYIEVGKKLVPEATWILGSVLDLDLMFSLGKFDQAISNPPFGNVKTGSIDGKKRLKYTGSEFEYKVIEVASLISKYGAFILPQMSTPWKYSGNRNMDVNNSTKLTKFIEQTGLEFEFNCGIDTSIYLNEWKGVSPMCEVAIFEFSEVNCQAEIKQLTLF